MAPDLAFLLVDDDATKRFLIAHHLSREFQNARLVECDSGAAAMSHLEQNKFHAVVTDNSMSPMNGLELIKWLRTRDSAVPVVMVTGNPDIEPDALEAGASAVLSSPRFHELGQILKGLIPDAV